MTKSCAECVNFAGARTQRQRELYGTTYPFSTCGATTKALGPITNSTTSDALNTAELMETVAEGCSQYSTTSGNRAPAKGKVYITIGASIPVEPTGHVITGAKPTSCNTCHFNVPAGVIEADGDINTADTSVCGKFARLIPSARASNIGGLCRSGVTFDPTNTVARQKDPYADGLKVIADHHVEQLKSIVVDPVIGRMIDFTSTILQDSTGFVTDHGATVTDEIIEPTTYETDKPVGPKAAAQGIRAWRAIKSADGKRQVMVPVFDPEIFSDDERSKIPQTGNSDHPEDYKDHLGLAYTLATLWLSLDETPALHGKAGTGKTELFRYMAWIMQLPFERISIHRASDIDSLAGYTHFENNETIFKYGRVPKSYMKPCVMLIDEPNVAPDEVWQFLRPMIDNSKVLNLDMNEGEAIPRHQFSFMGMAMNPAWDPLNIGAQEISDADGSRLMHIFVDLPEPAVEAEIIRRHCKTEGYDIEPDTLGMIMKVAKQIRQLCDTGTLNMSWGIRHQVKVARATEFFSPAQAYRLAAGDYLDLERRELLMSTVRDFTR